MNKKPYKKRYLFLKFIILTSIVMVTSHVILNNKRFQHFALNQLQARTGIEISWDEFNFTALTGHFSGKNLQAFIPKANASISLDNFSLAIDPVRLLFKKVHLLNLNAEKFEIIIEEFPYSPMIVKRKSAPKNTAQNLAYLINRFQIARSDIKSISIHLPGGKEVSLARLQAKSITPFLFYAHKIDFIFSDFSYRSPRFDAFLKQFKAYGSFKMSADEETGVTEPKFDGTIDATEIFLGFFKTPTPWNTDAAWDKSLDSLIEKFYPNGFSEDKGFALVNKVFLPLSYAKNQFNLNKGLIDAFGGLIELTAGYNARSGKTLINLKTPKEPRLELLPIGKANLKHAFETVDLSLSAEGKVKSLSQGKAPITLSLTLKKNLIEPDVGDLNISSKANFENGIIKIEKLDTQLGDGTLSAKGKIDLPKLTLDTNVSGNNLSAFTIVHFFSSIDIPGKANIDGTINGNLKNPTFNLKLTSPDFGYEGLAFGSFDGTLLIRDKTLDLKGTSLLANSGQGNLDLHIVDVFKPSRQKLELKSSFKALPAGNLIKTDILTGSVDGFFNFAKDKGNYNGDGDITLSTASWYGVPIAKINAKLKQKDKTLSIAPLSILWSEEEPIQNLTKPVVFNFSKDGYNFEGNVLNTVALKGNYNKANPDYLNMVFTAGLTDIHFVTPLFPFEINKMTTSGIFDITYKLKDASQTKIKTTLSSFELGGDEKSAKLIGKADLLLENQKLSFNNTAFQVGSGKLNINGFLGLKTDSSLKLSGQIDLSQLTNLNASLGESEGLIGCDLTIMGKLDDPSFQGSLSFNKAGFVLPFLAGDITDLTGKMNFDGKRVNTDKLLLNYQDAPVKMGGWIEWDKEKNISAANLKIDAKEVPFSKPNTWHTLGDLDVLLSGSGNNIKLSGNLNVVEGLYYKDYGISQFVLKPVGVSTEEKSIADNEFLKKLVFDLNIKSSGDLSIKNNLADINLVGNVEMTGTLERPILDGTVDVSEGDIHAFGIDFNDTSGFITFHPSTEKPILDFVARHEIQDFEVRALFKGTTDNLALSLESTPDLNQNDIVSLIAYGRTPDQLAQNDQSLFSTNAIASQVVGLLQRPLSKATKLDIVKLENQYDRVDPSVSRFSIGKSISDRVNLAFTTDLSLDEAYKGFVLEYRLYDNLLVKGSKDTGFRYRFDLAWRLQAY